MTKLTRRKYNLAQRTRKGMLQGGMAHLAHPNVVHEFVQRQISRRALQIGVGDCKFAVWVPPPREHAVVQVIPIQQFAADLIAQDQLRSQVAGKCHLMVALQ